MQRVLKALSETPGHRFSLTAKGGERCRPAVGSRQLPVFADIPTKKPGASKKEPKRRT